MTVEIFFCYAREDEELRKKLEKQLRALKRQGIIGIWYDREISPGAEWEREIDRHLNSAKIILLLVSPDFMDSDYCYSQEMLRAMERHERGEARVIPVILRPVYWQGAPFGKLQALPTDAKAIISRDLQYLDDAFFEVAEGIRKVVLELSELPIPSMPIPSDVAKWMRDKIIEDETMSHEQFVSKIRDEFGEEFIYTNENGNPAISKTVLKEFRKLTENLVVWDKGERRWRLRGEHDTPGKRQVDY
jgi:TIR domain